ncbi:lysine--tRNA ligase [Rickettsiales bacterium (ex Bugula neritina AB1)]|nr:lysine--tRNA ligase [Rickettsiales bacterium (ex Bugula neritina AB1)]
MTFENNIKNKLEILKSYDNAYQGSFEINYPLDEILKLEIGTFVKTAGRVISKRKFGSITFININNFKGKIQILIINSNFEKTLGEENIVNLIDIGDFIGVQGELSLSKTSEKTINCEYITILTKSLKQIPEKYHGLKDEEIKIRERYIDLINNDELKIIFKNRHLLINNIRNFLQNDAFIEVETPMLHTTPSGASAKPFKTFYEALNSDFYLRVAPELFLKRLLVAGFEKVFEINRNFRNEGIDTTHLQEFTMIEIYIAYMDYENLQKFTINFLQNIIKNTLGTLKIPLKESILDFENIERLSYNEFLVKYAGFDITKMSNEEITDKAKVIGLDTKIYRSIDAIKDAIYKKLCVQKVHNPILVYDYPSTPLSMPHPKKPGYNQQFQIIVKGCELIRACLELTDPYKQEKNFDDQLNLQKNTKEDEIVRKDIDFIKALKYGMPPAAGIGLGLDRLMMVLFDTSIRNVILFPSVIDTNINE